MLLSTSMVLQDPFDLIVIKIFTYIFQKKINNIWKKFIFLAEIPLSLIIRLIPLSCALASSQLAYHCKAEV